MKVTIDRDGCIECGLCSSTCEEVFELKDGEKAAITAKYRKTSPAEGEVGDDQKTCVQESMDGCPVQVISAS